jgi:hypothetical protein
MVHDQVPVVRSTAYDTMVRVRIRERTMVCTRVRIMVSYVTTTRVQYVRAYTWTLCHHFLMYVRTYYVVVPWYHGTYQVQCVLVPWSSTLVL